MYTWYAIEGTKASQWLGAESLYLEWCFLGLSNLRMVMLAQSQVRQPMKRQLTSATPIEGKPTTMKLVRCFTAFTP